MARSKHTRTLQHFVAMQLILSMQDKKADGSTWYPNVDHVKKSDQNQRMVPPPDINQGLSLMQDLLALVDPEVYTNFRNAILSNLNVDGVQLNDATCCAMAGYSMAFLHSTADAMQVEMWTDPPHPCTFISREVVAELLA